MAGVVKTFVCPNCSKNVCVWDDDDEGMCGGCNLTFTLVTLMEHQYQLENPPRSQPMKHPPPEWEKGKWWE